MKQMYVLLLRKEESAQQSILEMCLKDSERITNQGTIMKTPEAKMKELQLH